MITTISLRRAVVATAGAAALVLGASAAVASGSDPANPTPKGAAPDRAAVSTIFPPGSELQFVAVAPCRIADTRLAGGVLSAGSRVFDATLGSYAAQGGKAGSCNLPSSGVAAVQLNLGAISKFGSTSDIRGWATGTAEPTASLVNYNPSGPVANMVTVPVNAAGQFTLKTPGSAHAFIDVAGFYVKPLYASIDPSGNIYQGTASGVVSSARTGTGHYTITFDRDVERCAASGSAIQWFGNQEVSVDTGINANPNTVEYEIRDQSNTAIDSWAHISLTC
jgi:hypothetical protein